MTIVIVLFSMFMISMLLLIAYTNFPVVKHTHKGSGKKKFSYAVFSDIHGKTKFIGGNLSTIINRRNVDFALVAGDIISHQDDANRVLKQLAAIKCPVYLVLGNYERESKDGIGKQETNIEWFLSLVDTHENLTLLINEEASITCSGECISIYGFDNSVYGNEVFSGRGEASYQCVMAHSPNIMSLVKKEDIYYDHLITGHTHGGQINIPLLAKNAYSNFHTGDKIMKSGGMFTITKGLGTVKIPFRFRSRPEILVYERRD